jgi:hypothetical protein
MTGLLVLAVVVFALLGVAPVLLPWPQRVRWVALVASTPLDPWGMAGPVTSSGLWDVVTVCTVSSGAVPRVGVAFAACHRDAWLWCPLSAAEVGQLRAWAAERTPVLMGTDDSGRVALYGPEAAVVGLERDEVPPGGGDGAPVLGELTPEDLALLGVPSRPGLGSEARQ